jgi:hypothetical protein
MVQVARVKLDHHLPPGLHGSWSDACLAPDGAFSGAFEPTLHDIRSGAHKYA